MPRRRLAAYRDRVRASLEDAFSEELPPHDVATSFSVGVFVSALPNLGIALVLFVALAYTFERVSKLALFASVVVMNPPVKWAIYAASFWLGSRILGPVEGASVSELSLSLGPEVLVRLLVGNVVIAVVVAVVGYGIALRLIRELRRRDIDVVDHIAEPFSE
ncbi:DUF2062 domain-containing protein [Natronomonas gomsonensis]|uniref:DUF2062 domain-containing protein n=1 Tax=Natronomonas gomsonensis TaxID=1046043 RepID=UPI0015C08D60|nr:DUF2062 domain-containing protein [Natronomonas gomsonensis]